LDSFAFARLRRLISPGRVDSGVLKKIRIWIWEGFFVPVGDDGIQRFVLESGPIKRNEYKTQLVGGFNPFEKY